MLENLNRRADKCFHLACSRLQAHNPKHNTSESASDKENCVRLPTLVVEAELKNSHSYAQLLAREKQKLEQRVQQTACLKEGDINALIRDQKDRLLELKKANKREQAEISRLGDKLAGEGSLEHKYAQLWEEVEARRKDNELKAEKLDENTQKIAGLKAKKADLQQVIAEK